MVGKCYQKLQKRLSNSTYSVSNDLSSTIRTGGCQDQSEHKWILWGKETVNEIQVK